MIRSQKDGAVVCLTIDRAERRNAIDAATALALAEAIDHAQRDSDVRVLVIKGAGGVFSTGRDLKASAKQADTDNAERNGSTREDEAWVRIFHLLLRASIPSVAVVQGYAVAGGFTLSMGCDFVLAERAAVFGAYEMVHGFPAAVCTPILARLAGPRRAPACCWPDQSPGRRRRRPCAYRGRVRDAAGDTRSASRAADPRHVSRRGEHAARKRARDGPPTQSVECCIRRVRQGRPEAWREGIVTPVSSQVLETSTA